MCGGRETPRDTLWSKFLLRSSRKVTNNFVDSGTAENTKCLLEGNFWRGQDWKSLQECGDVKWLKVVVINGSKHSTSERHEICNYKGEYNLVLWS